MILTIITLVIRPSGALRAAVSVQAAREGAPDLDIRHMIAYWPGESDRSYATFGDHLSGIIRHTAPGWLLCLDDDTLLHPQLPARLAALAEETPDAWAFLFGMDYPAFGTLSPQLPPHVGHIDGGQAAIWQSYAASVAWPNGPRGDGLYLAALYATAPERWRCVGEVLTAHNAQELR